ncbi:transglycosylase domain-containing protein [Pseudonocardia sp.]|uniref:transglycosylase domain-containing protein n=1 Tax=Pseudonocardia sp. TaxID=60912 RepID=UPI0026146938|nr:transglycosylase domain-containing protein [Pseudonocardia sp.]
MTGSPGHGPPRGPTVIRLALVVLLSGVLLGTLLAVPAGAVATRAGLPLPDAPLPQRTSMPVASVLLDADGVPFARLFEQYRVPAGEVADTMRAAVVAIEDRRFLEHAGIDWRGVGRALVANTVSNGSPLDGQGASTITMQYVKNHRLYALAQGPEQREAATADTLERKLRDVTVALALERRLTKDEILARYLDTVYFGNGAYGVTAAARTYFATTPDALTLPQAALLAALVKAPEAFDPVTEPTAARDRRDLVLSVMEQVGSLTPAQAERARAGGLGVVDPLREAEEGCVAARPGTGFFCRHVVEHLGRLGIGPDELRTGGYTVRTTLDPRAQDAARRAATAQVPATAGIAHAVAVVEPGRDSRRVLALAANRTWGPDAAAGQSAYALPTDPVPYGAGSTYKIFTAAAALAAGVGLDDPLPAPERYASEVFGDDGEPYTVTGDGGAADPTTLRRALALSPNTTFLTLLDRLGSVDPVVDMARRLGMRESLAVQLPDGGTVGDAVRAQERASFTLGPVPAIPLELANVAATVISGGTWCPPDPVAAVTDRAGAPVAVEAAPCEQAVPEELAARLVTGLSDDHTIGTAQDAADAAGWDRPMIGKTGTTQSNRSAAFLGATPQLAGSVMTWSDRGRPVCAGDPPRLCDEGTLFGGTAPARTWFATMGPLHEGRPDVALPGTGSAG